MKFLRIQLSQAGSFGSSGGGGGGITTINGDTGTTGASTTPTIYANNASNQCGSSVEFIGDNAQTLTLNVTDVNNNTIVGKNSGNATLTGQQNLGFGPRLLVNLTSGSYNLAISDLALVTLTSGNSNTAAGIASFSNIDTESGNTGYGYQSGQIFYQGGDYNTCVGYNAGAFNATFCSGSFNLFLGSDTGINYSGAESNNILVSSPGVASESNTLRIGDGTGTGQQQLAATYISGIDGVALTTATVVTEVSDQLGTAAIIGGTGITIDATSTPNQIIINASGGGAATITTDDGHVESSPFVLNAFTGISTGTSNCGVTVNFSGDGANTINLNVSDSQNNTLVGVKAGQNNTISGNSNSGFGAYTLQGLTSGSGNMGFGSSMTSLLSGNNNFAGGLFALDNITSGSYNVGIGGNSVGLNWASSESNNIAINASTTTVASENNVCRIGDGTGTGTGQLQAAYISGIQGITVTGAAVLISTSDQLGIAVSSRKYKDNILDMGSASEDIYKLRPTTFNYKGSTETRYGLIAEEVSEVMPNLVVYDKSGDPQTVMYHELPALLLNEIQKLRKEIDDLKGK